MYNKENDELYIKMCRCPEVQGHRKKGFLEGDILANFREAWVNIDVDTRKRVKVLDSILVYMSGLAITVKDLVVWLPRQSDIQDMMGYKFPFIARMFSAHVEDNMEPEKFGSVLKTDSRSMHEFWLEFYMNERHKMVWNWGQWKHIQIWNPTKKEWENSKPEGKK